MSHNRILISFFLITSIAFSQEDIPFDISKQFAVPTDNNQLIWNNDSYFDILLIDRSSKKSLKIKKKIISHLKIKIPTYKFNQLPNDLKFIPITKPGSRYIK